MTNRNSCYYLITKWESLITWEIQKQNQNYADWQEILYDILQEQQMTSFWEAVIVTSHIFGRRMRLVVFPKNLVCGSSLIIPMLQRVALGQLELGPTRYPMTAVTISISQKCSL